MLIKGLQILTVLLFVLISIKILGFWIIQCFSRNKKNEPSNDYSTNEKIDIIISAFNEEEVIIDTVLNLLKIDYDKFTVIIVDDGSTDRTEELLRQTFPNNPKIKILSKKNNGKADALNYALSHSLADIIVFIDADTHVLPNLLKIVSTCFKHQKVVAMSGYLKVRNPCNMLTISQNIEYITTYNLERETFEKINTLTTIPGAICAYNKNQLMEIGGFNGKTITEDFDATLKLLSKNLIIRNEKKAVAFTEAPKSIHMFIRQRIRWNYGLIQNLLKYQKLRTNAEFFKDKLYIVFIYTWVYKIGYTILFVLTDYIFLASIYFEMKTIHLYYACFLLFDFVVLMFVLGRETERINYKILYFFFYKIVYRHLKLVALITAINKLISGKKLYWRKIRRYNSA